jgi:hypothetical protein
VSVPGKWMRGWGKETENEGDCKAGLYDAADRNLRFDSGCAGLGPVDRMKSSPQAEACPQNPHSCVNAMPAKLTTLASSIFHCS